MRECGAEIVSLSKLFLSFTLRCEEGHANSFSCQGAKNYLEQLKETKLTLSFDTFYELKSMGL